MSGADHTKLHHSGDVDNGQTVTLAAERVRAGDEPSQLPRAVETYLAELETGRHLDREEFIARYPEIADELRKCLDGLELIHRAGHQLSSAEQSPSSAAGHPASVNGTLGDFRILREIGRGGMGVVYEAEQISLPRRVALKVLPFAGVLDPRQLERFKNESRAAATLEHPAIVSVYSVGFERAVHFYAMQYIEGQSVAELIAQLRGDEQPDHTSSGVSQLTSRSVHSESQPCECQAGKATVEQAADVTPTHRTTGSSSSTPICGFESTQDRQYFRNVARLGVHAAEALDHAHARGIVHRDIKPGNLLLDAERNVYVADFGLARIEADPGMTMTGDILGTLRYMSPEQALAKRVVVDHRTDIYSLGATLYELVTLTPIFAGSDRQELLRKIAFQDPRAPCRINKSIPRDLETVVLKATAKEPASRYGSAKGLADDLRRFLNNVPVRAKRPTITDWITKWSSRHKALVGLAVIALALITLISLASAVMIGHARSDIADALEREKVLSKEARRNQRLAEQQTVWAEQLAYASDMRLAGLAVRARDPRRVLELLDRYQPRDGRHDCRGFEWYFFERMCRRNGNVRARLDTPIYSVHFSPDGVSIALAGANGFVQIRDAATGELQTELDARQGEVNTAVFSPDGRTLATAGDDGTVKLWELASQRCLHTIQAYEKLAFNVCFVHGGTLLATCGEHRTIGIWDVQTAVPRGHILRRPVTHDFIQDLDVSSDGRILVTAEDDGCARVWEIERAIRLGRKAGQRYQTPAKLRSVAIAPTGNWFVACGVVNELYGWKIGSDESLFKIQVPDEGQCVAVSADGRWIGLGDRGGTVRLFEVDVDAAPQSVFKVIERRVFHQHDGRVYGLAFSPVTGELISVGEDGRVVALGPESFRRRETVVKQLKGLSHIAPFQDRDLVATSGGDGVHLVYLDTGKLACHLKGSDAGNGPIAVSPDSRMLAVGETAGGIQIWDLASRMICHQLAFPGLNIDQLEFSPEGKVLAARLESTTVLIDVETGRVDSDLGKSGLDLWVAFSLDERHLAVARGESNTIELWDWKQKARRYIIPDQESGTRCMAFSPDGSRLAAIDNARRLTIWATEEGAVLTSSIIELDNVEALSFVGQGESLMIAAGHVVELWHVATGRRLVGLDIMTDGDNDWTVCRRGRFFCHLRRADSGKQLRIVPGTAGTVEW